MAQLAVNHQRQTFRFEDQFNSNTDRRRRDLRGRLFAKRVAIEIKTINSETVRLCYIETLAPTSRGHGHASDALSFLCEIADDAGVKIELCPVQMEDNAGLNLMQLTHWYQKYGFVRIGMNDEMMRYPNATTM